MRLDFETRASPAQVRRALTDLSERRPKTWRRSLNPKSSKVLDSRATPTVAKESSARSPFWVVCLYAWSDQDAVRWVITESKYGGPASAKVLAAPLVRAGRSLRRSPKYNRSFARGRYQNWLAPHLGSPWTEGAVNLSPMCSTTRPCAGAP